MSDEDFPILARIEDMVGDLNKALEIANGQAGLIVRINVHTVLPGGGDHRYRVTLATAVTRSGSER